MNYQKELKQYQQKGEKNLINIFNILNVAKYFSSGIFQNYLVPVPVKKYIRNFSGTIWVNSWKFNGISEETIENTTKSDSNFAPFFGWPSFITKHKF